MILLDLRRHAVAGQERVDGPQQSVSVAFYP